MGRLSSLYPTSDAVEEALNRANKAEVDISTMQQQINKIKLIMPEMYGAIGDGETDCTSAINRCFAENPNGTIIFAKGVYVISDTLHTYGNTGGQTIIFGGAVISWQGSSNGTMLDCSLSGGADSRAHFIGGEFMGNNAIDYGVVLNSYHAMIDGTKIIDCNVAHLVVGDISPTAARSLQAFITNVMIFTSRSGGKAFSDGGNTIGVLVTESDNFFSNINTNRMFKGIELRSGGHEFVNCHFTCQYLEPLPNPYDAYAVFINFPSSTSTAVVDFVNCYFDNYKYCFGSLSSNRCHINCSNSHYFYSGMQTTNNKVYTYLVNKYVPFVSTTAMAINTASTCVFLDAYCSGGGNTQTRGYLTQDFKKDVNRTNDAAYQTICAKNLFGNGESGYVIVNNPSVQEGDVFEVGAILLPSDNPNMMPPFEMTYSNRAYAYHKWNVRRSTRTDAWVVVDDGTYESSNTGDFYIENSGADITFNGETFKVYRLYFKSKVAGSLGYGFIEAQYTPIVAFYLNHSHMVSVSDFDESSCTKLPLSNAT